MSKSDPASLLHEVLKKPVAHRGLHDAARGVIENSATAFRLAVDKGYAIECDLQLSGDNVPMVIHDATIDRVTGQSGYVNGLSSGQLGRVPLQGSSDGDTTLSFDDLLRLVDGRVALAVELKPQEDGRDELLARKAVEVQKNYKGPLAFISFSPDLLVAVRKHGFSGPTGIIVERFNSEVAQAHLTPFRRFMMRHLLHYPRTRFDFVDCDHKALDLPAVRFFRFLGFPVAAWTITSQADADRALRHCDQIAFEGFDPSSG